MGTTPGEGAAQEAEIDAGPLLLKGDKMKINFYGLAGNDM